MSFEIEGEIVKIYETQKKSEKFQAREFVIKTADNYPQFVKFQLTQDKCDLIDNHKEGEQIKVHFDLRGREWNDKYFTNLNAWRLEQNSPQAVAAPPPTEPGGAAFEPVQVNAQQEVKAEDFNDLPF